MRLREIGSGPAPNWLLVAITLAVLIPICGCIPGFGGGFGGFVGAVFGGGAYGLGGAAAGPGGSGTPGPAPAPGEWKGYRGADGHWHIGNTGKPFTSDPNGGR